VSFKAGDRHGHGFVVRSAAATHLNDERRELAANVVPNDDL
jgi:hypothetical protein